MKKAFKNLAVVGALLIVIGSMCSFTSVENRANACGRCGGRLLQGQEKYQVSLARLVNMGMAVPAMLLLECSGLLPLNVKIALTE